MRALRVRSSLVLTTFRKGFDQITKRPIITSLGPSLFITQYHNIQIQRGQHLSSPASTSNISQAASMSQSTTADPCSLSNFDQAGIKHTDFEIDVDFTTKTLNCWGRHDVLIRQDGVQHLVLDTRGITVLSASVQGEPTDSAFDALHPNLGTALRISLPAGLKAGDKVSVELTWTTAPDAVAAQWLAPEQTDGGKYPYLFTQCQAIHARTLTPCDDSPGAKFTYTASVRVPQPLVAVMSALPAGEADDAPSSGGDSELQHLPPKSNTSVFKFVQPQPIPSYLLALVVGDLVSKDVGPVSRVWSEPSMVDAGVFEFAETPQFLAAAESIAGPYVWGRYDILLLCPNFPYGGMENPNITFVTPTLLAGDRSLANVVAHEIAHSWTGNLVTNRTWSSFWLNEGWTVWLERKIIGRLQGEKAFSLAASMGYLDLKAEIENFGKDHPFTVLVPDLSGVDPDDAFSSVPYEKGFYFLYYLEKLVGGAESFELFFRAYLDRFRGTPVTSDDFKAFFIEYFTAQGIPAIKDIDWDLWYYGRGMPPEVNTYDDSLAKDAFDLAVKWHTSDILGLGSDGPADAASDDLKGWSTQQIVAFLDKLGELRSMQPMHPTTIRKMDELYKLDGSTNSEIRCSWFLLAVKAGDESILPRVESFLKEQGRMKFVRPLFRALYNSAKCKPGKDLALKIFKEHGANYHPIASKMVAVDLKLVTSD